MSGKPVVIFPIHIVYIFLHFISWIYSGKIEFFIGFGIVKMQIGSIIDLIHT
ncbi:hypothetical protein CLV31_10921 [Algoriphagus aquaeductus]|uniref:Uncharacterized protein n=1 Tax=Algoriphagus aquaeductus TaxID=475299 RepID=A0A326RRF4_9BACT|nr:hypothetical protein CLV31_10921 [Algoriphagus aquaeductus]